MTRWTIPTLIQALVDEGVDVEVAAMVVQDTWPRTRGDDAYRSPTPALGNEHSYGAYGVVMPAAQWHRLGPAPALRTQAIYAANMLRDHPNNLVAFFDFAPQTDLVATAAAQATVSAIRGGIHVEAEQLPDDDGLSWRTSDTRADAAAQAVRARQMVDNLGR